MRDIEGRRRAGKKLTRSVMTFGTEVVCDALYKTTMKCEKASEVTFRVTAET
jgi:hypothetical protein